jgi:hypothetical protein
MIPQTFAVDADHPCYQIRPEFHWAALLIAKLHHAEDVAAGEICQCRCCEWARNHDA